MSSTIQVKVDDDLRRDSDKLFKELGTDTTTAIRMFLRQAVMHQGFPFEIKMPERDFYKPLSEQQLYDQLAHSREAAENGATRDAEDMVAEMRTKYGL